MMKNSTSLYLILASGLVLSYFLLHQVYGFTAHSSLLTRILYPICHANIWHLAANLVYLWLIRQLLSMNLIPAYLLAVFAAFLPSFMLWGEAPTTGFSGVMFVLVGMSWGKINRFYDMFWRNKWILIIPFFIPNINALLHLYCLVLGFAFGYLRSVCCLTAKTSK